MGRSGLEGERMNRISVRRLSIMIMGSILGAIVGNAIGAAIRSDNLPFLVLLGGAIGLGLSGVAAWAIIR